MPSVTYMGASVTQTKVHWIRVQYLNHRAMAAHLKVCRGRDLWIATSGTPASQSVPNCASITHTFCQSFCMVWRLGPRQQRLRRHSTLLINGVYPASWIYTGQSASPTTRSDQEPNNHYCITQSAPDAFTPLVTSAELTPVRIILGHCTPVLLVCPSTGGEDPTGRDRPGYELLRMIYGHSIWVWWQLNGVLRTQQLGRHSWKWLRHWQTPDDDDDERSWCFS